VHAVGDGPRVERIAPFGRADGGVVGRAVIEGDVDLGYAVGVGRDAAERYDVLVGDLYVGGFQPAHGFLATDPEGARRHGALNRVQVDGVGLEQVLVVGQVEQPERYGEAVAAVEPRPFRAVEAPEQLGDAVVVEGHAGDDEVRSHNLRIGGNLHLHDRLVGLYIDREGRGGRIEGTARRRVARGVYGPERHRGAAVRE